MSGVSPGARLFLYGYPRLELSDGSPIKISSSKALALLALLATADRGTRSRAWLQQKLWGSRELKQAQTSLRRELSNLRKALGPASELLEADVRSVRLQLDRMWVDVLHPEGRAGSTEQFLEGLDIAGEEDFEDWLREMRSRLMHAPVPSHVEWSHVPSARAPQPELRSKIAVENIVETGDPAEGSRPAAQIGLTLVDYLSRIRWLPVTALGMHPGQEVIEHARYLLKTQLQHNADGTAQLLIAFLERPGNLLRWTDTRPLTKPCDAAVISRELARIVNCVGHVFDMRERQRIKGPDAIDLENLDELSWLIRYHSEQYSAEGLRLAEDLIEQALAKHPEHAELHVLAAHHALLSHSFFRQGKENLENVGRLARRAIRQVNFDSRGHLYLGIVERWLGNLDSATRHLMKSAKLDPTSAHAAGHLGCVSYLKGEIDLAIDLLSYATFVAPLDQHRYHWLTELAVALFFGNRREEALACTAEVKEYRPDDLLTRVVEIAALAGNGMWARALEAYQEGETHWSEVPELLTAMPFVDTELRDRLASGVEAIELMVSGSSKKLSRPVMNANGRH